MSQHLSDFTRGSQLLGHFAFMFAAGIKWPFLGTLFSGVAVVAWALFGTLSDHEIYLLGQHLYALGYLWLEFDPGKALNVELAGGGTTRMTMAQVSSYPPVVLAWAKAMVALRTGAMIAGVLLVPLLLLFFWFATMFGDHSKQSRHQRGALLAALPDLRRQIAAHNRSERSVVMRRRFGPGWRLAGRNALFEAGIHAPYSIGGVTYPLGLEQSHTMLVGTTGTGKTVVLRDILKQSRARNVRSVVFDLTGAFIEAFYDPDRDVILNAMDARCPQWTLFDEASSEAEFTAIAEALVPHDGGGSEQFWVQAARLLFVEMALRLQAEGRGTNAALADELMTADLKHVHELMKGTVADPITAPEAARMAELIRAVFNANAKALKLMPKTGPRFSIRKWVEEDRQNGSILFLSARYIDMSVASRLLTLWMDTAMNTLMSMSRTHDLRLWFLIDELGALHRLPALEKGLQTARNFGGAIVTGVHAYAKLKDTYGENMAMTLLSLARTKLIFATADRETATWCSDFIGHRQVKDIEEGFSYGYNNVRDSVTLTPRRQVEPLLLPDQLMNLERLSGYIKFPDGFPAAKVALRCVDYPAIANGFVPIHAARSGPASVQTEDAHANDEHEGSGSKRKAVGADDQGPGKPEERQLKRQNRRDDNAEFEPDKTQFDPAHRMADTVFREDQVQKGKTQPEDREAIAGVKSKGSSDLGKDPHHSSARHNAGTQNKAARNIDLLRDRDAYDHDDLTAREQRQAFADRDEPGPPLGDLDMDI